VWLLVSFQSATLLVYLKYNIVSIGSGGVALPVLAVFVGASVVLFLALWMKDRLYVRPHLFLFLGLVTWIAFRVVYDLGDLDRLKALTIATTGGMLLFYLMGAALRIGYQQLVQDERVRWPITLALSLVVFLLVWILLEFSGRLHSRYFLLTGIDGGYQRPGNSLSIVFLVFSFLFILGALKTQSLSSRLKSEVLWVTIYVAVAITMLGTAQLMGSNSATAVIAGVTVITLALAVFAPRRTAFLSYVRGRLALPLSKRLLRSMALSALVGLVAVVLGIAALIAATGFELERLRVLGFGTGRVSSLASRLDIMMEHGAAQLSYAPLFGNMNVAYLTTGNAGSTLHSFFPYVMANLGLVGLALVVLLFLTVFIQLYRESKARPSGGAYAYRWNMIAVYSFLILLYLLVFANLATGVSWVVLWFALGFISQPVTFRSRWLEADQRLSFRGKTN
jgi:hypothetical protein